MSDLSINERNEIHRLSEQSKHLNVKIILFEEELEKLRKGNEILREMGRFYASENNWQTPESQGFHVDEVCLGVKDMIEEIDSRDSSMGGNRARQALKEYAELMGDLK